MKYAELDQSIDRSEMFFARRSLSMLGEEGEEIGVKVGWITTVSRDHESMSRLEPLYSEIEFDRML